MPEVQPLIDKINAHLEREKTTLNAFAKKIGQQQSGLHRFVSGERKTITDAAKAASVFIDNWHKSHKPLRQVTLHRAAHKSIEGNLDVIEKAVQAHWDGSRRSATLIAMLIRAVAPVIEAAGKQQG